MSFCNPVAPVSGYLCLARFPKKNRNFALTMNWTVIIIETFVMTAAFTAMDFNYKSK